MGGGFQLQNPAHIFHLVAEIDTLRLIYATVQPQHFSSSTLGISTATHIVGAASQVMGCGGGD